MRTLSYICERGHIVTTSEPSDGLKCPACVHGKPCGGTLQPSGRRRTKNAV